MTREKALKNAEDWVDKRIMYSQSRYYEGYRQDCSGFVSMTLELDDSYTTRSIDNVLKRIDTKELRAGDAVLTPGHIVVFVKWEDKNNTFLCMEESSSGKPARYKIKTILNGSKAYTLSGITTEQEIKDKEYKEFMKKENEKTLNALKVRSIVFLNVFTAEEILLLNN